MLANDALNNRALIWVYTVNPGISANILGKHTVIPLPQTKNIKALSCELSPGFCYYPLPISTNIKMFFMPRVNQISHLILYPVNPHLKAL